MPFLPFGSGVAFASFALLATSGGFMASGSNAPLYSANFFGSSDPVQDREMHERRLALALDVDTSIRMLSPSPAHSPSGSVDHSPDYGFGISRKLVWKDNEWTKVGTIFSLW